MRRAVVALLLLACSACRSRSDVDIAAEPLREAPREAQGDAEVAIPAAANGVLPPGAADAILPIGSAPLVRLLDSGAEPRADLSYALVKGGSSRMAMAMDTAVAVKTGGQANPQLPMPRVSLIFESRTVDKAAVGDAQIESKLASSAVEPSGAQQEQVAQVLKPQFDALKGLTIGYWVTPKGQIRDLKVDVPPGAPRPAQQLTVGIAEAVQGMILPLPSGAVGVGARWQVVTRVSRGGADMLQSAIYTLKSRGAGKASVEATLVQVAGANVIHTAQMPPGMNAKLTAFKSGGSATTSLDLASVSPDAGTLRLKSGMTLLVDAPGAGPEESTVETTSVVQVGKP